MRALEDSRQLLQASLQAHALVRFDGWCSVFLLTCEHALDIRL